MSDPKAETIIVDQMPGGSNLISTALEGGLFMYDVERPGDAWNEGILLHCATLPDAKALIEALNKYSVD